MTEKEELEMYRTAFLGACGLILICTQQGRVGDFEPDGGQVAKALSWCPSDGLPVAKIMDEALEYAAKTASTK